MRLGLLAACAVALSCLSDPGEHRDFSGMWDTYFGYMQLRQNHEKVEGKYRSDIGSIKGQAKGDTLFFDWKDNEGQGDGYFVMSADGRTLSGAYRLKGHEDWDGQWSGVKISK